MKIVVSHGLLSVQNELFQVSNRIRSLENGLRGSWEVARTIPGNFPYDPHPFPKGLWNITGVDWLEDSGLTARTYGPVKIKTDAWQMVPVWELDEEGDYLRQMEMAVRDTCYWLHYSEFSSTLGCIRLSSPGDAIKIANLAEAAFRSGEQVLLEVL
jgi:hypothetical protein